MEINHLKLNNREYLLRKDEWIRRFEDLESNEVTAYYNVVFEKVDGRIVGFIEEEKLFYLGDEKLNQIIFRAADDQGGSQAFGLRSG
jgi:hypothetical protein